MIRLLLPLLSLVGLVGCKSTSNLEVVSNFNAERYMGTWYEAARFPHGFERGLSSVSATYSPNEDGTVKVVNRGFNEAEQAWDEIEGVARFKNHSDQGWLEVSFFKPFYGAYKIIYLDEAYTQAIVTGPTYDYLWILVRDPKISQSELDNLVSLAQKQGFETNRLIFVDQAKTPS